MDNFVKGLQIKLSKLYLSYSKLLKRKEVKKKKWHLRENIPLFFKYTNLIAGAAYEISFIVHRNAGTAYCHDRVSGNLIASDPQCQCSICGQKQIIKCWFTLFSTALTIRLLC